MAQLDEEGSIWYPCWYPCFTDGSYDTGRRPQLKRYLEEMRGPDYGECLDGHFAGQLASARAAWLSYTETDRFAGSNYH